MTVIDIDLAKASRADVLLFKQYIGKWDTKDYFTCITIKQSNWAPTRETINFNLFYGGELYFAIIPD